MRTILIAGLAAASIGLAGATKTSAAPVNGAAISDRAGATDVTPVHGGYFGHGPHGPHGEFGGHWPHHGHHGHHGPHHGPHHGHWD